ncbi:hypothetical protein [Staphylococcus capitis]|uniref:hypothetical protein n=1 Tax=Staphylococcus capitis TaxID=29388 RepID=UPI00145AB2D7|nr:hypothetical protein [Staphylococcus capitis]MEB5628417.1 hypothetical protein [Staphylococcus capitis]NMK90631.1 hypothetical protein [Staphylococcus capitis]NMK92031.1 hypothetical protein [Staphylococcus capitis]
MSNRQYDLLSMVSAFTTILGGSILGNLVLQDATHFIFALVIIVLTATFVVNVCIKDKVVTEYKKSDVIRKLEQRFIA